MNLIHLYIAIFEYINTLIQISVQNDQEDNIYIHYFDFTVWF